MPRFAWSFAAPLALSIALFAGACKDSGHEATLAQDTTLTRDLQLANRDTAAQPQLNDVPESTPAPAPTPKPARSTTRTKPRPKTTPRTPPPAPVTTPSGNTLELTEKGSEAPVATVGAGTLIDLTSNERVCTNTHKVGDRFTATVSTPVSGVSGTLIPVSATAVIQVTAAERSENANDPIKLAFSVVSMSWNGKTYPMPSEVTHVDVKKVRNSSKGNDAKKVIGGAVAGAILGQVIGHDTKSTVIGAAAGAAAGTAVAVGTANYEGCVPAGGRIQIKLTSPASVQAD